MERIQQNVVERHKYNKIENREERLSDSYHIEKHFRIVKLYGVVDAPYHTLEHCENHVKGSIFPRNTKQKDIVFQYRARFYLLFFFFSFCHYAFTSEST